MRFFNTAGPVDCERHYCLPPLHRIDLDEVLLLIEQQKYFVLHAPRQTGKTSFLLALMEHLNGLGRYKTLYVNVEGAQAARQNVPEAMRAILAGIATQASQFLDDSFPNEKVKELTVNLSPFSALNELLSEWADHSPLPLVIFIDEIDSLIGDTLIAVLRQLRGGYDKRPAHFPQSVILCGVRDVRDYRLHVTGEAAPITGGSAFNIKSESIRMGNFAEDEVMRLLYQHTEETGQPFTPEASQRIWYLTQGQPWLVNALAYETCFKMKENRDRSRTISQEQVEQAKENLILRRETHLDQLTDKLKEPRVRRVIEPMVKGEALAADVSALDIEYVVDLGLVRRGSAGLVIANPIYQEVIPRDLSFVTQIALESIQQSAWYINEDGQLDTGRLLAAFQDFFRHHSEHWVERFEYKEAGPQLLLQAFLQRVVNGGGRIEREYGLGRGRTDLLILWPGDGSGQRIVIECKIVRGALDATIREGLAQTQRYMDRCNASSGHLVLFNRDPQLSWDQKIFQRNQSYENRIIHVWGM